MNKELNEQEINFLKELLRDYMSDDLSNTSKVIITNIIDKLNG